MNKTYKFHVSGMHCKACVLLIESVLGEVPGVTEVKVSLAKMSAEVTGDFEETSGEQSTTDVGKQGDAEQVAAKLSSLLKPHGYSLSVEKERQTVKWGEFVYAGAFAFLFVLFFLLLQKMGLVNLVSGDDVGYGTAFVVGIVASLSTCMAVVGGLVLSMSANFAKEGDKVRPQVLFHVGRLVAFFVLGGVIGALGAFVQLGVTGTFVMSLLVAIVLLILGVNLLDIFPGLKKLQPTLPAFIGRHVRGISNFNHTVTPVLLGVVTFILPCGFTQSMQLYSLTTGSFLTGAMTMFVFALGTLPVLALLSFGSVGVHGRTQSGIFFKTAGLIVIFFGLFNLINSFVGVGLIPPFYNL